MLLQDLKLAATPVTVPIAMEALQPVTAIQHVSNSMTAAQILAKSV